MIKEVWTIKSFRYLLVMVLMVVLLLVAASGCGGGSEVGEPKGNQSGGESDEGGGKTGGETGSKTGVTGVSVTLTPPEGWEKKESSGALLLYTKGPSNFTVSRDSIPAEAASLDSYLTFAQNKLSGRYDGIDFSSAENLKVGGYDGKKYFTAYEMANTPFKMVIVYILRDNYAYHLQGGAMAEDFDSVLPDFEALISSFKFE